MLRASPFFICGYDRSEKSDLVLHSIRSDDGKEIFHAILSDGNSADGTDVCRAFAIRDFAVDITISVHIFEQIGSLSHHIIALGRSNSDPNITCYHNHDP